MCWCVCCCVIRAGSVTLYMYSSTWRKNGPCVDDRNAVAVRLCSVEKRITSSSCCSDEAVRFIHSVNDFCRHFSSVSECLAAASYVLTQGWASWVCGQSWGAQQTEGTRIIIYDINSTSYNVRKSRKPIHASSDCLSGFWMQFQIKRSYIVTNKSLMKAAEALLTVVSWENMKLLKILNWPDIITTRSAHQMTSLKKHQRYESFNHAHADSAHSFFLFMNVMNGQVLILQTNFTTQRFSNTPKYDARDPVICCYIISCINTH